MPPRTTSSGWRRGCGRLRRQADVRADAPRQRFDTIEMRNIVFSYIDKSSEAVFQVGPVDFTLRSGDLVFITGGNGSGKSTFLKLLAGLYEPDSARFCSMACAWTTATAMPIARLIAAIFVDYHLFQRLYGIADPDLARSIGC